MNATNPLLACIVPSATLCTSIPIHVYDQALERSRVPRGATRAKAIGLAMNSVNWLASTMQLTGGISVIQGASAKAWGSVAEDARSERKCRSNSDQCSRHDPAGLSLDLHM